MQTITRVVTLAAAATLAALPACGVNRVGTANLEQSNVETGRVIRDATLWSDVRVIGVNESSPRGTLLVSANVRNNGTEPREYEYKFTFYDRQGVQVAHSSSMRWRRESLLPGEVDSLVQAAGSTNATAWLLQIRKPVDPTR